METFGRTVLVADRPREYTAASVGRILDAVMETHLQNAAELEYLWDFYRGDQDILERVKEVRPEITHNTVENRAWEIVNFKLGYEFSHPVLYTNAKSGDEVTGPDVAYENPYISVLNKFARVDKKERKDVKLAEWMYVGGTSYRMCMPIRHMTEDTAPYFTASMDPRTTFVVYANEPDGPVLFAGSTVERTERGPDGKDVVYVITGVYTETAFFEWKIAVDDMKAAAYEDAPTSRQDVNGLGMIPIIEYPLNEARLGYVELVRDLLNAINNLTSNCIEDIEQTVQSFLILINADLPKDDDGNPKIPKKNSVLSIGNGTSNSDAKFISNRLGHDQTHFTKADLLQALYEIAGVPDRQSRNQGGGDTGQAVVLRNGWGASEARAKTTEKVFKASEFELLKIILRICRDTTSVDIGDLTLHDIDVKFTRNRNDNMLVKAQTMQMLLHSGANPEDVYEVVELWSDAPATWQRSKSWQEQNADRVPRNTVIGTWPGPLVPETEPPPAG